MLFFENFVKNESLNLTWVDKFHPDLSKKQSETDLNQVKEFLAHSRLEVDKSETQKRRRRSAILLGVCLISMVLAGLSIWALNQKEYAENKALEAENERKNATTAKQNAEKSQEIALES